MSAPEDLADPRSTEAVPASPNSRATILIVDDNAAKRLALRAALSPLGYPIVEANTGTAALRCVAAQDFAVILLDVRMPVMDGFETAGLIRQRQQSEKTPIIFITAHAKDDILNPELSTEGAVDFIFAPVPPEELRAKVSTFANLFIRTEELAARAPQGEAAEPQRLTATALLEFSGEQTLQAQSTDLHAVVDAALDLVEPLMGVHVELSRERDPDLQRVVVDRDQLQHVILNLCVNARDAMRGAGTLTVRTYEATVDESHTSGQVEVTPGSYGVLEVTDSGSGMDEETLSRILDPLFTMNETGTLATVFGIVKASGGHVAVDSEVGVGTTLKVYLPYAGARVAAPGSVPASPALVEGTETILFVEDNDILRPLVAEVLAGFGYTVWAARDGAEAITNAKEHSTNIDLLLTDMVMPGLDGGELAVALTESYPDLKVLFTSGYPAGTIAQRGFAESRASFIQKPFLGNELARKIRATLDADQVTRP